MPKAQLAPGPPGRRRGDAQGRAGRLLGDGGVAPCPVLTHALGAGVELRGPALVEEAGATIVLYPGHHAPVDGLGNLLVVVPR